MRNLMLMCILLVTGIMVNAQSITVASDRDLDADFSEYKTFSWTSQVDNELDEGLYFLNDLVFKSKIRDAVESEMMGLGYTETKNDPDLLVNFRVFEEPVRIKGYEGYGTSYWGNEQYRLISDTTSYAVEAGTLLISLVDREEGAIVWQGFASGLIDDDKFIKDEVKIYEAVNMIFEDYNQRAREYTKR